MAEVGDTPEPSAATTPDTERVAAPERDRALDRLRRLHGLLGVFALPAFLCFHLWEQWPAVSGQAAWVARARDGSEASTVLLVALAVAILLHGCIGLGLALGRPRVSADPLENALRPHQMVSGSLVLVFVVYHLWHVGVDHSGPHASVLAAHGVLWDELGRPLPLIAYVVGVSAACFHLGLGLARAASIRLYEDHAVGLQLARLAAGMVAFWIWLLFIQLVAYYAMGVPLFPVG